MDSIIIFQTRQKTKNYVKEAKQADLLQPIKAAISGTRLLKNGKRKKKQEQENSLVKGLLLFAYF